MLNLFLKNEPKGLSERKRGESDQRRRDSLNDREGKEKYENNNFTKSRVGTTEDKRSV